ncbi:MAG TPA: VWA domain-containing protein [Deinococcales bacterium]|nr:VWA domain-containing protein [Deinococcales bacterium]
MTFESPLWLLLLALVPAAVLLARWTGARRRDSSGEIVEGRLQPAVVVRPTARREGWPLGLQVAAASLLLFAASGPIASPLLPVNKAAVVVALDTSRSMLAADLNPTRLEAGKEVVRQLAARLPQSTLLGLVTFSSGAALLVPPTIDRAAVLKALEGVKLAQSTSLASAVVAGVRAMPGRSRVAVPRELGGPPPAAGGSQEPPAETRDDLTPAALVILSDGVSNRGPSPATAAKFASDNKVKVHSFGLGKAGGTVATVDGQPYFIPFDPNSLKAMAEATGGEYVYPPTTETLDRIARELGTVIRFEPVKVKLAGLLAALGVVLIAAAAVVSLRWHGRMP